MKKSKLKAKITELEAEKAELKKDIYLLIDATDESEVDGLKDHYRFTRKMRRDLTKCVMFGQRGFGPGPIIKHKTGIITHIGEA